jgi:hypothetical protein
MAGSRSPQDLSSRNSYTIGRPVASGQAILPMTLYRSPSSTINRFKRINIMAELDVMTKLIALWRRGFVFQSSGYGGLSRHMTTVRWGRTQAQHP